MPVETVGIKHYGLISVPVCMTFLNRFVGLWSQNESTASCHYTSHVKHVGFDWILRGFTLVVHRKWTTGAGVCWVRGPYAEQFSASRKMPNNVTSVSWWKLVHGSVRDTQPHCKRQLGDTYVNGSQQTTGHRNKKIAIKIYHIDKHSTDGTEIKCENCCTYECDAK